MEILCPTGVAVQHDPSGTFPAKGPIGDVCPTPGGLPLTPRCQVLMETSWQRSTVDWYRHLILHIAYNASCDSGDASALFLAKATAGTILITDIRHVIEPGMAVRQTHIFTAAEVFGIGSTASFLLAFLSIIL